MIKAHFIGGSRHGQFIPLKSALNCVTLQRSFGGWLKEALDEHPYATPSPKPEEHYFIFCQFADVAVYIGELTTAAHRTAYENLRWLTPITRSTAVGYAIWMESVFAESLETDLTFQINLTSIGFEFLPLHQQ